MAQRVSVIRIALIVLCMLALIPATITFGLVGFIGTLFVILLAVLAK